MVKPFSLPVLVAIITPFNDVIDFDKLEELIEQITMEAMPLLSAGLPGSEYFAGSGACSCGKIYGGKSRT